ncbi:ABC transporter permease [Promicromonospora vindobonensis]|uniref:ABC transporter permease n=1 Tax=Promicromonospora vindobonensis TaxID=195748 RepID=A0ABW5VY53_9MICO
MSFWTTWTAELRKAATLPASWVAVAVTLLGSAGVTALNAFAARSALGSGAQQDGEFFSAFGTAYAAVPLGTVGAVVLGVVVMSSEYTANSTDAGSGRQITTTLAAVPRRPRLLAAKALTVVLLVMATAAVTIPTGVGVACLIIGEGAPETVTLGDALVRSLGATLYWTLTGLIALAVTVLARSGIIPLVVLITNSSLVSFSLLLTNVTPLAHWLPDMAGRRLFGGLSTVEGGLDAAPGALVMAAWTVGLLAVAGVVLSRRDA